MNKPILALLAAVGSLALLSSCASFQNAQAVSDYDGDGIISDAEYKQFHMQKNVEDRNVYSERAKRANVRDTFRDVRDITGNARSIKNILNNF